LGGRDYRVELIGNQTECDSNNVSVSFIYLCVRCLFEFVIFVVLGFVIPIVCLCYQFVCFESMFAFVLRMLSHLLLRSGGFRKSEYFRVMPLFSQDCNGSL